MMRRLFIDKLSILLNLCFMSAASSQYGVNSVPTYTLFDHGDFNESATHEIEQRWSLLRVGATSEENRIRVFKDTRLDKQMMVSVICLDGEDFSIKVSSPGNPEVLQIIGDKNMTFKCETFQNNGNMSLNSRRWINMKTQFNLTLESGIIGVSSLVFELEAIEMNVTHGINGTAAVDVLVLREITFIDNVFLLTVYALEILEMLTFGTQLDFDIVKETLKTPIPPLIGLLCQYLCMPLISFAIAKAVASDSLTAVGIFAAGVCPGGGSSNIYTYLLDGDLSLSITMTTISTVLSIGLLPFWLYTLGGEFLEKNDLNIPYTDIMVTLSIILVPLSVGLFIRIKFPNITDRIEKVMAIVLTVLAVILITTGVISSLYLFDMFDWKIIVVGMFLPYLGFCIGAIIAFIFKQPRKRITTIAIETGMQNTAIAMILLLNTFPEPLGDISTVAPLSAEVMSPIPPFVISTIYLIWKSCCKKYKQVEQIDEEKVDEKQNCKEMNGTDVKSMNSKTDFVI